MEAPTFTLDGLQQELCAYYKDDVISPGLQLAYLPSDNLFYAAVHQFPSNVASRKVIAKAKATTSAEAILACMQVWRNMIAAQS